MSNDSSFEATIIAPVIIGVVGIAFVIIFIIMCVKACRQKNTDLQSRLQNIHFIHHRADLDNKTVEESVDDNVIDCRIKTNRDIMKPLSRQIGLKQFLLRNKNWTLDDKKPQSENVDEINIQQSSSSEPSEPSHQ